MRYFVYMITGPSDKVYVGITRNPKDRWRDHRKSKRDHPLYRAMKLYGRDTFSMHVVGEYATLELVKQAEVDLIRSLNTQHRDYGYNNSPGGDYDAISGPIALRAKLENDPAFAAAYSLRSVESTTRQWAERTPEQKQVVCAAIAQTLKTRCQTDPVFAQAQRERMLAARAKGDVKARGRAASRGIKQFWADLRQDPKRYAAYIDQRRETLKQTNARKKK